MPIDHSIEAKEKLNKFLDSFSEPYREGNLIFAYYAAFPGVFTPNMLYQLWLNFRSYEKNGEPKQIHHLAISDLLNSELCREIGFELFEMDSSVKKLLAREPQHHLPDVKILFKKKELAAFTWIFAEKYFSTPGRQNIKDVLFWESAFYLHPGYAANKIAYALEDASPSDKLTHRDIRLLLKVLEMQDTFSDQENFKGFNKYPLISDEKEEENARLINDEQLIRKYWEYVGRKHKKENVLSVLIKNLDKNYPYEETIEVLNKLGDYFRRINIENGIEKVGYAHGYLREYTRFMKVKNPEYQDFYLLLDNCIGEILDLLSSDSEKDEQVANNVCSLFFLGGAGVGKTSLINRLFDESFDSFIKSTHRINFSIGKFQSKGDRKFIAKIYDINEFKEYTNFRFEDFQDNGLFIIVWDGYDENNIKSWLTYIHHVSQRPVMVIRSKMDINPLKKDWTNTFKGNYPNVIDYFEVSVKTNAGTESLKQRIAEWLDGIKTDYIPMSWLKSQEAILKINKLSITYESFSEICKGNNIVETQAIQSLLQYLHSKSLVLYSKDNSTLAKTVFLNSWWILDGINLVFESSIIRTNNGILNSSELNTIWENTEYQKVIAELRELLIILDQCYFDQSKDQYFFPNFFAREVSSFGWNEDDNLRLRYHYEVMPNGLIHKLILELYNRVKNNHPWGGGIYLEIENTKVYVQKVKLHNIDVKVEGKKKKEVEKLIDDILFKVNTIFKDIEVSKMISCVCENCINSITPHYYNIEILKARLNQGVETVKCEKAPYYPAKIISILGKSAIKLFKETIGGENYNDNFIWALKILTGSDEGKLFCLPNPNFQKSSVVIRNSVKGKNRNTLILSDLGISASQAKINFIDLKWRVTLPKYKNKAKETVTIHDGDIFLVYSTKIMLVKLTANNILQYGIQPGLKIEFSSKSLQRKIVRGDSQKLDELIRQIKISRKNIHSKLKKRHGRGKLYCYFDKGTEVENANSLYKIGFWNYKFPDCNVLLKFKDDYNNNIDYPFPIESSIQGLNFENQNLDNADFSSVKIFSTTFKSASLKNAKFNYSNINKCIFDKADISSSSFDEANILDTTFFEANLSNTTFRKSNIKECFFGNALLRSALFEDANIFESVFDFAELSHTSFINSNLQKAFFHNIVVKEELNLLESNITESFISLKYFTEEITNQGLELLHQLYAFHNIQKIRDTSNNLFSKLKGIGVDPIKIEKLENSINDFIKITQKKGGFSIGSIVNLSDFRTQLFKLIDYKENGQKLSYSWNILYISNDYAENYNLIVNELENLKNDYFIAKSIKEAKDILAQDFKGNLSDKVGNFYPVNSIVLILCDIDGYISKEGEKIYRASEAYDFLRDLNSAIPNVIRLVLFIPGYAKMIFPRLKEVVRIEEKLLLNKAAKDLVFDKLQVEGNQIYNKLLSIPKTGKWSESSSRHYAKFRQANNEEENERMISERALNIIKKVRTIKSQNEKLTYEKRASQKIASYLDLPNKDNYTFLDKLVARRAILGLYMDGWDKYDIVQIVFGGYIPGFKEELFKEIGDNYQRNAPNISNIFTRLLSLSTNLGKLILDNNILVEEQSWILKNFGPLKIPVERHFFDRIGKSISFLQNKLKNEKSRLLKYIINISNIEELLGLLRIAIDTAEETKDKNARNTFYKALKSTFQDKKYEKVINQYDVLSHLVEQSLSRSTFSDISAIIWNWIRPFLAKEVTENDAAESFKNGTKQYNDGNFNKAVTQFKKAIDTRKALLNLEPSNTAFKNSLAISYEKLGLSYQALVQEDKALKTFERALDLYKELNESNPDNLSYKTSLATIFKNIGHIYSSSGELQKAILNYEEAIRFNPNDSRLWLGKGKAEYNSGNFKNALASSKKVIDLDNQNAEAWSLLGDIFKSEKEFNEAIHAYNNALSIDSSLQDLYEKREEIYRLNENEFNKKNVPLTPGTSITLQGSQYKIIKKLATSHLVTIHQIYHEDQNKHYVIKLYHNRSDQNNNILVKIRDLEFDFGQLSLPYTIKTHHKGEINGNPYFIMDYHPNTLYPMDVKVYEEKLLTDFIVKLLTGLQAIHDTGIVHGDIKPTNILIDKNDDPVIIDLLYSDVLFETEFSKKHLETLTTDFTRIYGTNVTPEQVAAGGYAKPTVATDIFSFGVTMYEIISEGNHPFFDGNIRKKDGIRSADFNNYKPIERYRENVPAAWKEILEKCLKIRSEDRFQSFGEIKQRLINSFKRIYFSYAWGDDSKKEHNQEIIVKQLYESLKVEGFNVLRDKMDLQYGSLINDFMKELRRGDMIIVFISDKYLCSPYCMYELYEIARNSKWDKENFINRVLPVQVEHVNLADPLVLKNYFDYWEEELNKRNQFARGNQQLSDGQMDKFKNTKLILQNFGRLVEWLQDVYMAPQLTEENFSSIKNLIIKLPLAESESLIWSNVVQTNTIESYSDYLKRYPSGKYLEQAKNKLIEFNRIVSSHSEGKGKNHLFVIAIDDYKYLSKLNNPVRDSEDLKSILIEQYDFEERHVTTLYNAAKDKIVDQLLNYQRLLDKDDNLIIYYSGHGQTGFHFMLSDAQPKKKSSFLFGTVFLRYLSELNIGNILLIIDAAFSDQLIRSIKRRNILRLSPSITAIGAGNLVQDGSQGQNSPFTRVLLETLKEQNKGKLSIPKFCDSIIQKGFAKGLTPVYSSINSNPEFSLNKKKEPEKVIKNSTSIIVSLPNDFSIELMFVEGGTFTMGSFEDNGKPKHHVILPSYYMSKYPITQKIWESIYKSNPSKYRGPKRPVEQVSWNDIQKYIQQLNAFTAYQFRLPSEAEWEYAAQGGKYSKGYNYAGNEDLDKVGWYAKNSKGETKAVEQKMPNELGLFDMSGNIWEWCADQWHDNYQNAPNDGSVWIGQGRINTRVIRGGSYSDDELHCRCDYRSFLQSTDIRDNVGFRLVLSV